MFGNGLMTAVLTIRPDMKALRRELEKEVPKALRQAARGAEKEAARGFKKVGDEAGDQLERGIEHGIDDGVKKGARDAVRNSKGQFAKAGEQAGKSIGDGIEKGVDRAAKKSAVGLSQRMSSFGDKAVKTGAVMTAGLTLPFAMLAKSSATAAMEHEDTLGAIEQMYKGASGRINKWIEDGAGKMQLSKTTAAGGAFSLSGYMTGMYGETDKAATQTIDTLELLADSVAFYGGNIEEKLAAYASAMNGSFEPLETQFAGAAMRMSDVVAKASQMGLLDVDAGKITDANIKAAKAEEKLQKLRKEGKTATTEYKEAERQLEKARDDADKAAQGAADSLSQEARWIATDTLLKERLAKAEGAVNRERETASGQMREAEKEWDNMKLALGEALLPVIAELAPKFAELFRSMADNGTLDRLVPAIAKLADVLALALDLFTKLPSGVQTAIMGFALFGGPALTMLGTITKLTGALGGLGGALGGLGGAGGAGGAGLAGLATRAGPVGVAVAAGSAGWGIGSWINNNMNRGGGRISDKLGNQIADWLGYDNGGVHMPSGVPMGAHTPALIAKGETMVPTHKYPAGEALARVGLAPDTSRLEGLVAAAMSRPSSVTVVAPPGMDLHGLAREIDKVRRGSESLVLRPRANRRPA